MKIIVGIMAVVLLLAGLSWAEEPKVYTEEDLKGYSKQPMSDQKKAQESIDRHKERKMIEDNNAKVEAEEERRRKLEESAVQAEWEKVKVEKEKADAMEDFNREYQRQNLLNNNRRGYGR